MARRKAQIDFKDLDRTRRIQVTLLAVVRLVLVLTAGMLLYFLIPVDGFNEVDPLAAWVRLIVVSLAFLVVLGLQVRIVVAAGVPQVRAVEAVVECVVAFLLLFALLYLSLSTTDSSSFSERLDRVDALYFTSSTFATVGFGDIVPVTQLTRVLVAIQMMAGIGVLVMIAKVTFYAAKKGLGQKP